MSKENTIILYITDEGLCAYERDNVGTSNQREFLRNGDGLIKFGEYLSARSDINYKILVNSVEEEYKVETMPHIGKRRKAMLERNLRRYYKNNVFKFSTIQGRESFGKKEDKILLTSVVTDVILTTWLQPLLDRKSSIIGICSMPMVTENVVQNLGAITDKLLVVTQDKSGLRITYLDKNQFKISRLIKSDISHIEDMLQEISEEIDKTLLYLGRIRLVFPDQKADILFIGSTQLTQAIIDHKIKSKSNSNTGNWIYFDVETLKSTLSLESDEIQDGSVVADLFVHALDRSNNQNHYANNDHVRYHRSRKLQLPLEVSATFILLALLIVSVVLYIDSMVLGTQQDKLLVDVKIAESRFLTSMAGLPDYPLSADSVRLGVNSVKLLLDDKPNMSLSLVALSQSIAKFKNIQLSYLRWAVEEREISIGYIEEDVNLEEVDLEESASPIDPTEIADVSDDGEGVKRWMQVITLRGRLVKFVGNYTAANNIIDELVAEISRNQVFRSVVAIQKPMNQKPEKSISGKTNKRGKSGNTEFSLEIITDESKLS